MPHLLINAGPGCGKTTVLTNLFSYIRATNRDSWEKTATEEQLAIYEWCRINLPEECREKMAYCAYNNDIVADVKKKLHPKAEAKTIHGWGYSVLNTQHGFLKLNRYRAEYIVSQVTGQAMSNMENKEKFKWLSTIRHLEKLKDELLELTLENFQHIHRKYAELAPFAVFNDIHEYAKKLIVPMKTPDRRVGIDFIDQVWLALFSVKQPIYPLGVVDEAQDLSPARLRLCRLLFKNIIFCGDTNQAINAFSGADPHSFDRIKEFVDHEMPLKVSFRCPPNICNYLNALTPAQVRPTPGKEDGVESRMTLKEAIKHIKLLNTASIPEPPTDPTQLKYFERYGIKFGLNEWETTLILCRYNAPLVKVCIELINSDIPAYLLGDTLIDNLSRIVKGRNAQSIDQLEDKLDQYVEICSRNASDLVISQIIDNVNCIKAVTPFCNYPEDVEKELKKFLKPKPAGHLKLSTIHRAKGLEAKHTFILFPPIEYPKCDTEDEKQQERNLHFVAVSRTKRNLTWIVQD